MSMKIFLTVGLVLALVGLAVSILFWLPGLINRPRLKGSLGNRYPLIYFVYVANGPLLLVVGLFLIFVSVGH